MPPAVDLPGLGPRALVPYRASLDWSKVQLSSEEGFILSRVDGTTSLGDICMLMPFPEEQTASLLKRLWLHGVIDIPGLDKPKAVSQSTPAVANLLDVDLPDKVPPGIELTLDQLQRIELFFHTLSARNAFQMLEVDPKSDDKTIKKAYFKLSKEFHPDRFFGKAIGEYKQRLTTIFQAIKSAFELLSDHGRREAYEDSLGLNR
jgi:hypothetical protein